MMRSVSEHIRAHALESVGAHIENLGACSPAEIRRTQWSPAFEAAFRVACAEYEGVCVNEEFLVLMRNRLVVGALRYGRSVGSTFCAWPHYDCAVGLVSKIRAYEASGNTELCVDIANYLLLVFESPDQPLPRLSCVSRHEAGYLPSDLAYSLGILVDYPDHYRVRNGVAHAAVWCMREFNRPTHPLAHFKAMDRAE